jgi:predicted ATPase
LFIIEDLQWVDPTTLDVLGEMIEAIRDERVLVLLTARPEFVSAWRHHPMSHATP